MEIVKRAFSSNSHGWGLCFTGKDANGEGPQRWWYCKGMKLSELTASVAAYVSKDNIAVLHCRIASVGKVSEENAHPFMLNRHGMMLLHNGTLSSFPTSPGATDSQGLADWLNGIENLPVLLRSARWRRGLDALISPSKIVITDNNNNRPKLYIIGERRGETEGKLWASNSTAFKQSYKWAASDYVPGMWSKNYEDRECKIRPTGWCETHLERCDDLATGTHLFAEGRGGECLIHKTSLCTKYTPCTWTDKRRGEYCTTHKTYLCKQRTTLAIVGDEPAIDIKDTRNFGWGSDTDPVKDLEPWDMGTDGMAAAGRFDGMSNYEEVLAAVKADPELAAQALWFFHGMVEA